MLKGILALQGDFDAHAARVRAEGHEVRFVRNAKDFESIDELILPGGESTTMLRLLASAGMEEALVRFVLSGAPVFATCAGLILLAARVENPSQRSLGLLDVTVTRNGWGRQVRSFEALDDRGEQSLVFIRAPRITSAGPKVAVLMTYQGEPVLVRQGNITAATFHPEWTAGLSGAGALTLRAAHEHPYPAACFSRAARLM